MVFLYKKKSTFRNMFSVLMALAVAVCAMATIVIAQENPAAQPSIVAVQGDATIVTGADSTEQSGREGISNEYIAAATVVESASAAAETPAQVAETNAPAPEMAAQEVVPAQPAPAVETNEVVVDGEIQSITFKKDMSLRDALRFLQARFHKNIVMSSMKVDGVIAVTQLYDVTFEEALNAILGSGFKWEQEGNFIKIYTVEEYKKIKTDEGRLQHKVFTLYYVTATEAEKLVKPILS
ncbi:MAG: hypothetical protein Q7T18_09315, partial [Sedimentisphaerales bacterium]|nr:hypothetical protein [Sedimentisphaerales bacterium]